MPLATLLHLWAPLMLLIVIIWNNYRIIIDGFVNSFAVYLFFEFIRSYPLLSLLILFRLVLFIYSINQLDIGYSLSMQDLNGPGLGNPGKLPTEGNPGVSGPSGGPNPVGPPHVGSDSDFHTTQLVDYLRQERRSRGHTGLFYISDTNIGVLKYHGDDTRHLPDGYEDNMRRILRHVYTRHGLLFKLRDPNGTIITDNFLGSVRALRENYNLN